MRASKYSRRKVEYIWKEHIPYGMMSITAGPPGKGKSTFGLRIAADVSHEEPVIISSYEEPTEESIIPKLEAAGANMGNIEILKMRFPRDNKKLSEMVKKDGFRLIIMDTAIDNTNGNIYAPKDIRNSVEFLVEFCNQSDLAAHLITHTIKNINLKADPLAAIGGSQGGLSAMVRIAYLFGNSPHDIDERALVQLKCNVDYDRPGLKFELDVHEFDDGVTAPFLIDGGTCSYKPVQIFTAEPKNDPSKLEFAAEWLVETLKKAGGELPFKTLGEMAKGAGIRSRLIRRVAEEVGIDESTSTDGALDGALVWKLPPLPLEANIDNIAGKEQEEEQDE